MAFLFLQKMQRHTKFRVNVSQQKSDGQRQINTTTKLAPSRMDTPLVWFLFHDRMGDYCAKLLSRRRKITISKNRF